MVTLIAYRRQVIAALSLAQDKNPQSLKIRQPDLDKYLLLEEDAVRNSSDNPDICGKQSYRSRLSHMYGQTGLNSGKQTGTFPGSDLLHQRDSGRSYNRWNIPDCRTDRAGIQNIQFL